MNNQSSDKTASARRMVPAILECSKILEVLMGDLIQFIESYVRSLTANSERCVSFMIEHDPLAGKCR
jgi:hypothetical protein